MSLLHEIPCLLTCPPVCLTLEPETCPLNPHERRETCHQSIASDAHHKRRLERNNAVGGHRHAHSVARAATATTNTVGPPRSSQCSAVPLVVVVEPQQLDSERRHNHQHQHDATAANIHQLAR